MGTTRVILVVLALCGCLHVHGTFAAASIQFDTVAYIGQQVPGAPAGTTWRHFDRPVCLNDSGQIALYGSLQGTGVTVDNGVGIWSGDPAALGVAVRQDDVAPGLGGGSKIKNLSNVLSGVNSSGQVAFSCALSGTGDDATFTASPLGMQLVARQGDHAPGTAAGVTFTSIGVTPPTINNSAQIFTGGFLAGPGVTTANERGLWVGAAGSLQLVARLGSAAPAAASGTTFGNFGSSGINSAGQLAFWASLEGESVTSANDTTLWTGVAGNLQLLAREGDPAPGVSNVRFSNLNQQPAINRYGAVAFSSQIVNASGAPAGFALWSGTTGAVQLAARSGDSAPGQPAGVVFASFANPVLSASGHLAMRTAVGGTGVTVASNTAISFGLPGFIRMIAREGDQAAGTPAGTIFADFSTFSEPALNPIGQLVFWNPLTGVGVNSTNDSGIWYTDPGGTLRLLLREGDAFDIDDGPATSLRTISSLAIATKSAGDDGAASGFNVNGQLAVTLGFTDGSSGVFIAQALPEPLCLWFLGVLALSRRRRR